MFQAHCNGCTQRTVGNDALNEALNAFIAKARQLRPTAVIVCILPADGLTPDDELAVEGADFALPQPFTTPHLRGVLRQADEKLLLLQEVAALRTARRGTG